MFVINRNDIEAFITKDKSEIREIMSPANSNIERQSLAEAIVYPGDSTIIHIHKTSEEIYYILEGKGLMEINNEQQPVKKGDAIANLPGVPHRIKNTSNTPLVFLCMCTPRYTHEDTVLLEKK
ncbi:cupin domain-containing protein [bacterium]|nr:cupin domain-containing protein [bacterium]